MRGQAMFALGELAGNCQPEMSAHAREALPCVFAAMAEDNPTLQQQACYALDSFCEHLGAHVPSMVVILQRSTRQTCGTASLSGSQETGAPPVKKDTVIHVLHSHARVLLAVMPSSDECRVMQRRRSRSFWSRCWRGWARCWAGAAVWSHSSVLSAPSPLQPLLPELASSHMLPPCCHYSDLT